jgi:hypothetical protein
VLLPHFLSSPADRPPLRIGLVLDGTTLPRHALEIVRHVRASNFARVEIAVIGSAPRKREPTAWLFGLYRRWDEPQGAGVTDPLALVDGTTELEGIATIPTADLKLDVLLDLRPAGDAGGLTLTARYGVWRLRHGEDGAPSAFWEVYEGRALTRAALVVRGAEGTSGPVSLCACVVATAQGLSWARNLPAPYWAANTFVIQKLWELHSRGWEEVARHAVAMQAPAGAGPRGTPTNWDMCRWLVPGVLGKAVRRLVRPATRLEWRIAVRQSDRGLLDREPADRATGFRWMTAPPGHALADPFLVEHDGKTWVFLEDIDVASGRGRIGVAEVAPDGTFGEPALVIERPHHVSYPCVFADNGEMLMIPESSRHGAVELHRSRRFPYDWTLDCVLLQVPAVDTTVWIEQGQYWLFTTLLEPRSHTGQLWLFFADAIRGPWTPHPGNPISADVRNYRGAGAMFRHGGRLYRPSQDCSGRYGRTFSLNEVDVLTRDRYAERAVVTVEPEPGFVGTHTYARSGSIEMIDGRFVRRASQ